MAINPSRQESRLKKTQETLSKIKNLEEKAKNLLEEQDQRQVQTTLLENQIADMKSRDEATTELEQQVQQIVQQYGDTSKLLNTITTEVTELRKQHPNIEQREELQKSALSRAEAAYPAKLKRHLRKCRQHGWVDARLGGKK